MAMRPPEPPDGTRIEFQEHGSPGGDLIGLHRDDKSSAEAGWPTGDGGKVWCEYGYSVPVTWDEVLSDPRLAACVNGVRLVPESELAAAEERGYQKAVDELRAVVGRTGSPSAKTWADYLDVPTNRRAAGIVDTPVRDWEETDTPQRSADD